MKQKPRSFGRKLWLCFVLFAAVIFAALWLLQTVFLQTFYNRMAIADVKRAASRIEKRQQEGEEGLEELLDQLALEHSFLIFLTDWEGTILYSADEHNALYQKKRPEEQEGGSQNNPYRNPEEKRSWERAAFRNLPQDYPDFLAALLKSQNGSVGYTDTTKKNSVYVYGKRLPGNSQTEYAEAGSAGMALYISTQLDGAGAAVGILRTQLIWVTCASVLISLVIAWFLSRQFAAPVAAISRQAEHMAAGEYEASRLVPYKKGFCQELDALAEGMWEASRSLEQLEQARRELLANVSHDLRTPLTMIKGYAELIRDISWEDETDREADLSIIIREADRLTGLVEDCLEYSALWRGEVPEEKQSVDISSMAEQVLGQFLPLCCQRHCQVETQIEPGQQAEGNERQLQRVLYNLIDNAIRHTREEKGIRIVVKEAGERVYVAIQDYGQGIPEEELPYIWERYFTTKNRRDGAGDSGLGLAITKEILRRHQAEFGVESKEGEGSLFWFRMKKTNQEGV